MTTAQKNALINRADKFIIKLQNATYGNIDLMNFIEDIIYALADRLERDNSILWENTFNYVKHDNKLAYSNEQDNFYELVKALIKLLEDYKEFIKMV